jgi:multisubunit Na+/H+ antiporter MnhE subunit
MRRFVCRLLLLAGLWWLLAGGDGWSWLIGGPVISVLAVWRLSDAGGEEERLQLWRLPMFVPLFVWRMCVGSCDAVAAHGRLCAPEMRRNP